MEDDIVCLLQDLGPELAATVIANYLIRNPESESLVASKVSTLVVTPNPTDAQLQGRQESTNVAPSSNVNQSGSTTSRATTQPEQDSSSTSNLFGILSSPLSFLTSNLQEFKMIFVVNMELNMGRGKQCAQVAHAALGLYLKIYNSAVHDDQHKMYLWIESGQKKIVVKGNNLGQLETIKTMAKESKLPCHIVTDAGCTQIAPGSKTVLAIFGEERQLNMITGALKLL